MRSRLVLWGHWAEQRQDQRTCDVTRPQTLSARDKVGHEGGKYQQGYLGISGRDDCLKSKS